MTAGRRLLGFAILFFCLIGCGEEKKPAPLERQSEPAPMPANPPRVQDDATKPVMKIAVMRDGRLIVDGKSSTIESLAAALEGLATKQGSVWYYREGALEEPPPVALQVIDAVIKARLPIRLSTRPDYSDAVDVDKKTTK